MTTVYFVRHCKSNSRNHDDFSRELTEQGLKDRELVTRFFKDKEIGAVLSSPYKRAIDTVKPVADERGLVIRTFDDLRERETGRGWIEDFLDYVKAQWTDMNYKFPEGESLLDVQARNVAVLEDIVREYEGQNVVVGSHGTALSTIVNYYDKSFGFEEFYEIIDIMPWIVAFEFDENGNFTGLRRFVPGEDC
ncbi:MAG: histidine phosphatase family protein [Clostridiales bacterium]|nr:histidine phosphatase family protein [Clostridiales bacterium]